MKTSTSTPKKAKSSTLELIREVDNIATGEITTESPVLSERTLNKSNTGNEAIFARVQIAKNAQGESISARVHLEQETKGSILLKETAREIREQYTIALKGIVAWAKMGLVLIAVRNTFPPRGGFVDWMESEFPDLSRRGLYNAMKAAEGILLTSGEESENLSLEDAEKIESYAHLAIGKTKRFLMDSAKMSKNPEQEEKAKAEVEKLFELYPDKREHWVPLIEAGERTWGDALRGITGAEKSVNEDGTRKTREAYLPLFEKMLSIPASIKNVGTWSAIPMESQPKIIEAATEILKFIPPALRETVLRKLAEDTETEE